MSNIILFSFRFSADRLHHAVAYFQTVARINVNMPAPQTIGAVIGKAVAFDRLTAMAVFEIFHPPSESHNVCTAKL